jgi:hypothetical protein
MIPLRLDLVLTALENAIIVGVLVFHVWATRDKIHFWEIAAIVFNDMVVSA